MCIGDALRELAGVLDGCEEEGLVTGVGLVERHDRGGEDSRELSAEVELTLSPPAEDGNGLVLRGASVDGDGRLGLEFGSLDPVVPAPDGRVEIEPTDARFGSDGEVTVTLAATVPTGDEPAPAEETTTAEEPTTDGGPTAASGRNRDVPPFRDPELLAEVYDSFDTFAEMTEAIGMDVTAETVRRYMIDYGIHQPNTYDTNGDDAEDEDTVGAEADPASDSDPDGEPDTRASIPEAEGSRATAEVDEDGSPVVLADGIGLPDDVTVETLIGTVKASNTLYEVERDIGVDREDALDMLRELNLLDLVVGRLSTQDRRDISREDVVERLREASATAAGTSG
ncbi:MAG: hypothetical protein V5A62_06160 [Haloarculaceae archaeon]